MIDNSSAWRYDSRRAAGRAGGECRCACAGMKKGIIANPNCSTAQLVVALKPLHDHAMIKRVVVATYQSVSGAGKDGMDELDRQTKALYSLQDVKEEEVSQAHRLQRDPPHRRVHGGWLHEGRMEDDGGDQEDPRSEDQAHRNLRARSRLHRPFRSRQCRVRKPDLGRGGPHDPALGAGRHGRR